MFSIGLERCNPARARKDWTNFENLVSRFVEEPFFDGKTTWTPSSDVVETDHEIKIHMDLPGLKKDNLDIQLSGNNTLVVLGERKYEEQEGSKYYRRERFRGTFTRTFLLPTHVEQDKISATFNDGVLEITLPKAESAKTRRIEVKS